MSDLAPWSARITDDGGAVWGAGIHLGGGLVLTCAHVVTDALGVGDVGDRPTGRVFVDFPGLAATRSPATVEPDGWWPRDEALRGDAAVLRLVEPPPSGAAAAPLTAECPEDARVRTYGYPDGRDFGVHARARIAGATLSRGWYQLEDDRLRGEPIRPGFSGAGVLLDATGEVAGMVSFATADTGGTALRVSWMLPVRVLAERLRPVAAALRLTAAPKARPATPPAAGPGTSCPLPADLRDFTGREDVLADADAEIEEAGDAPVVRTVHGMGGIGKTALAVRVAHRHRARYPDGQFFIDLQAHSPDAEPLTAEQALRTLLRATLGRPPREDSTPRELAAVWQDVMTSRRMIVVLDNADSYDQIAPLLPRAGQVLALVTSRRWLEELGWEHGVPTRLTPFGEGSSTELLRRIVGRRRVDAEPEAARDLLRMCGQLPLAIRLKAAYAKGRPDWSLADIRDEMAEEQRAAVDDGGPDAEADAGRLGRLRLGSAHPVHTAFRTSFRRLSEPQQRLFRLLGLHPPDTMDRRVAEALTGDSRAAGDHLEVLVRESLVSEHGRSRIGMHDLLREYARGELAAGESWEARREAAHRLVDCYLATALTAHRALLPARPVADAADLPHPRPPDVSSLARSLRWFETEHQNLLGCIDLAARYGHTSYRWRLPRAMGAYLSLSSSAEEAIPRYEQGIAAAADADPRAVADLHGLLGEALRIEGRQERSLAEFRTARARYLDLGAAVEAADMLARGSAPQRNVEGSEPSVASCLRALEEYTAAGDTFGSAEAEYLLATAARLDGDRDRALSRLDRALGLYREAGYVGGEARCLNLMGVIQRLGGDHSTAIATLEEAVRLYRAAHDNRGIAHAVNNLASVLALAGRLAEAVELHGEALERFREHSAYGYPDALLVAGDLRSRQGDHVAAEAQLREAVRRYRPMRESFGEARAHLLLAAALRGQGRHGEAIRAAGDALDLYRTARSEPGQVAARAELEACRAESATADERRGGG